MRNETSTLWKKKNCLMAFYFISSLAAHAFLRLILQRADYAAIWRNKIPAKHRGNPFFDMFFYAKFTTHAPCHGGDVLIDRHVGFPRG